MAVCEDQLQELEWFTQEKTERGSDDTFKNFKSC